MVLPSVAIVGGGASGALTAIHLLRLARATATPLAVTLIDQGGLARARPGLLDHRSAPPAQHPGRAHERLRRRS
ncbi:FAD/NAD(P)-binding protein [Nonomuraea sp. N2-4H]